jgi:hypothetical protein
VEYSLHASDLWKMLIAHHAEAHHLPDSETRIQSHFEKYEDESAVWRAKRLLLDPRTSPQHAVPKPLPFIINLELYRWPSGLALFLESADTSSKAPSRHPEDYFNTLTWKDTASQHLNMSSQFRISENALSGVQSATKHSDVENQSNEYLQ